MSRARAWLLTGVVAAALAGAGAVGARALQDTPAEARPADPIGDILRNTPTTPEAAPVATPAPAAPVVVSPADPVVTAQVDEKADEAEAEEEKTAAPAAPEEAPPPGRRTRRPIAVVQAIDKITAESMRFEVEVGGRPVRFDKTLIVSARACEVSASDEVVNDSVAYLDISVQPRGAQNQEPRQIFRGWMFASTPAVSGLQHPVYDAWVVGCKA